MAQDFRIELGVVTNLKPAEKQVQEFIRKQGNKEFTLTPKISTKGINEFRDQFKGIQTEVKLAQAELDKFTQYNEKIATSKINDSLRDMAKVLGNIKAPVKETSTSFDKWVDSQGKLITQTRKFDNELGTVITRVEQYKNELGQTVTETTTFNDSWEKLAHNMDVVDDRVARAAEEEKKLAEAERLAAKETNSLAKEQSSQLERINSTITAHRSLADTIFDATKKVALFKVSTTLITAFSDAVNGAIATVNEFDSALTEFKKVSDLSGEALDNYTDKLGKLGEAVARSRTQMVEAATEFKKSGYSNEQSAELAQIASLFQNVADSELSAGDAADYVISQMKAFGMKTTEEAQGIIDKTNEVSNNFAVSSTDISQALTKTSSAMAAYGNSIDETISLTTAGAEILNGNVGKVAKGLRSIGANITNLASASDTFEISVDGATKSIKLINEETGDMLSTYEVLEQISQYWDDMNSSEQSTLALTLANKTQFEVFTSVLSNFDTAERALTTSLTSQGSAWKENEAYLQSNEASINSIKASLQELILNSHIDEFIKLILQATAELLKFANSGFGQVIIYSTLAFNGLNLLFNLFDTFSTKTLPLLITKFAALGTSLNSVSAAEVLAKVKTLELGAALELLGLNPLILAITAVVGAITLLNHHIDEERQRIEEINSEIESFTQQNEEAIKVVKKLKEQIAELNENKLEITDPEQLSQLEAQSAELENQLRLQYDLIEANKQKIKDDYEEKLKSGQNEYTSRGINLFGDVKEHTYHDTMTNVYADQKMQVEQLTEKLKGLQVQKESLGVTEEQYQNYLETGNGLSEDAVNKYEKLNEKITDVNGALISAKGDFAETTQWMQEASDAGVELTDTAQSILDSADEVITKSEDTTMSIEELADKYGVSVKAITEYMTANEGATKSEAAAAVAAEEAANAQEEENTALQDLSSTLTSLSTDYQSLKTAVDEYNSGGTMSLETLDALINAATNYSGCLELQNGKLVLSEQYFENLAQQKIANAKADLVMETQTKLANLAIDKQSKSVKSTASTIDTSKSSVDNICTSLQNMAGDAINAAQAWNALKTEMDDSKKGVDYSKQVDKVRDEFTAQWKTLDNIGKQISGNFSNYSEKAAKSASGSHKSSAKESKDAWLEAYKSEKDALESLYKTNVITAEEYAQKLRELSDKYLTDSADHQKKYAKEIHDAYEAMYTALKKSAKEALDEEEKRLKKQLDDLKDEAKLREKDLKRAHDSEEKAIKKKIDAQKEYNKEALKGIKSQIDALKREKDATKDSYDKRIDALKSEREEYDRQVKLMQLKEELAKAKATMQYVMDETGHFTYQKDSTAVDQAQENLIEEERKQQYERELSALEDARDSANEIYEQRIQSLEDYYDTVKEQQDKAIDQMEKYLDEVKDRHDQEEQALSDHYDALEAQYERNYNDFKENADKYLNGQMQLTNNENTEWGRRLTNLANFVNEYNRLMNSLNSGSTSNSSGYSGQGSSGGKIATTPKSPSKASPKAKPDGVKYSKGSFSLADKAKIRASFGKHATGIASINSDEMALVGDSPNQELVIGSKLNGVPLSLSRGDGVVNAKSTKTLAGILNMIGGLAKPLAPNQTNNNSTSNITISNVSLPNVHNGEEFINCLQHFDIDMMQRSYDTY